MEINNRSSSHAVFNLELHIVFVTKYRRPTLAPALHESLEEAFTACLAAWRCKLIEIGGELDHVHLLVEIHPALDISVLINNLKTASARRLRNRFADHLAPFYSKPLFWSRAYFVSSVAGATLETVRRYVQSQGTEPKPNRATLKSKEKSIGLTPS